MIINPNEKNMLLGTVITFSAGGGILPFKGMAFMIYNLFIEGMSEAGLEVDQVSYMISAIITAILICVLFAMLMKPLFRVDFSRLKMWILYLFAQKAAPGLINVRA